MPKLIVCGDSWMTPDYYNYKNTHFSELFAKELGYDLVTYARGGMSNGGIALQIEQAILDKPDLILFGTTVIDRIELSMNSGEDTNNRYVNKYASMFDISYHPRIVNNNTSPILISDNLMSLLYEPIIEKYPKASDPKEKDDAIKQWFMHMYSPMMKRKIDLWCMRAVLHKLYVSNIPAILVIDLLNMPITEVPWYECITGDTYRQNYVDLSNGAAGYHTLPQQQIEILNLIKDNL
jgi:hypothetical protein